MGSEATPARGKPHGSAALIGAGVAGLELPTAFPYFAAIALIIGSGVSRPAKLALLVLYCIVYTLPLIAIVVVCVVMGNTANRILAPTGDWLSTHWPAIAAPLTATMGIAVLDERDGCSGSRLELVDVIERVEVGHAREAQKRADDERHPGVALAEQSQRQ